jgi:putative peptidoglycan lipid II flippase
MSRPALPERKQPALPEMKQPALPERKRPARPLGRAARLALLVTAGVAAVPFVARRAVGQSAVPATPGNALALTAQTGWVSSSSNGDFRMGLSIQAADPGRTRVAVTVYQRLTSRSDFDESLAGRIHTPARHFFQAAQLTSLQPDATGTYGIDLPVNPSPLPPSQDFLRVVTPGVYPVEVTLIDHNLHALAQLVTHLLYTGDAVASQPRLDVAWVLPVRAPPVLTPAGRSDRPPPSSSQALATLAAGLSQFPEVPVTLAPTAQTLEALAIGSASDRAALKTLAGVAARPGTQVVDRPYVAMDLPAVVASGLDSELSAQLRRAGQTLSATLGVRPDLRTWVEGGQLDRASVDALIDRGVDRLIVDARVPAPLPADMLSTTLAQPFTLRGGGGRRVVAVAADSGLASHFAAGRNQVLAAHQLLADLAIIQSERPANTRGVAVLTPTDWRADPAFLRETLDGLAASPWLKPVTVDQLFAGVPRARERQTDLERTIAAQSSGTPVPNAGAIRSTRHGLDSFSTIVPADSTLYADLERPLLIGEAVDLPLRDRNAAIGLVTRLIDQQAHLVRLPTNTSITLTARRGRFPVTITSTAPYPVRVQIRLRSSQKLEFQPIGAPAAACRSAGTSESCVLDLRTQNTTLKVPVVARTAGVFTLTIDLMSPDGGLTLASTQDTVRSTAASGVGILLSIGAAFLLAIWWIRDLRHGRRARGLVPAPPGGIDPGDPTGTDGDDWLIADLGSAGRIRLDDQRAPARPAALAAGRRSGDRLVGVAGPPLTPPLVSPHADVSPDAARQARVARPAEGTGPGQAVAPEDAAGSVPVDAVEGADSGSGRDRADRATPAAALPASFPRNAAVMASGTVLSRITGLARVLALIYAFGALRLSDIYSLANTAPNILYDLVLGGVLSATLIPVFVDWFGRDDEDGWRAVSAVVTAIAVALAVLTALFWLVAPAIIRLYLVLDHSPGGAGQRALGTTLLRLFAPQLFLLGGIAVTTALLSARRQFFAVAYSPVVMNLVTVAAIVGARVVAGTLDIDAFRRNTLAVLILGLGTTAGYLCQLLAQLPALLRSGWRLRPVWDLRHPAVRTVLRLSLWTFGAVVANQVAFNLVLIMAARRAGDVVAFQTAFQFFQLPHAIFAVSIATVMTPDLSDRWARGDIAGFRRQLADGLRFTLAIIVPAAVGYVLLARPAMALFVRHGGVGGSTSHLIGTIVVLFAVGLPGFSVYLLFMRAYQAMQDTRSMFWLYVLENGLTVVLAIALYPSLGVGGLALGWVGAYSVVAVAAYVHLGRRTGGLQGRDTAKSCVLIAVASAVMAGAVAAILRVGPPSTSFRGPRVAMAVGAGAAVYVTVGRLLGMAELRSVLALRRRSQ